LHEYQKKRVTEKAFRNLLILKGAILVEKTKSKNRKANFKEKKRQLQERKEAAGLPKQKAGERLPHSKRSSL